MILQILVESDEIFQNNLEILNQEITKINMKINKERKGKERKNNRTAANI